MRGASVWKWPPLRSVYIRDSKDVHRPYLSVNTDHWAAFVDFAAAH
jgi:hypothetical protein